LPLGDRFDARPGWRELTSVGSNADARRQQCDDRRCLSSNDGRLEQTLSWLDFEIVRDIEDVGDEGSVNAATLDVQVEVAERYGVSVGDRGAGKNKEPGRQRHDKRARASSVF
jgi:hypothetical protein